MLAQLLANLQHEIYSFCSEKDVFGCPCLTLDCDVVLMRIEVLFAMIVNISFACWSQLKQEDTNPHTLPHTLPHTKL